MDDHERVCQRLGPVEMRKWRKRQQNLVNQRARRARIQQRKEESDKDNPYVVRRWRLQGGKATSQLIENNVMNAVSSEEASLQVDQALFPVAWRAAAYNSASPHVDMLFSLVQQNVYRALLHNKHTLGRSATTLHQRDGDFFWHRMPCYGASVVVPLGSPIPDALAPTHLQMNKPHSPWINLIPFPLMRDNLIRWEARFNHAEFLHDLVGMDFCVAGRDYKYVPTPQKIPRKSRLALDVEDQGTAGIQGFVVSGEASRMDSWELTPAFLHKWTWVVDGCEEVIEISNRWRRLRGDGPLCLVPVAD